MGQRASDTRGITFTDVRVPKEVIINVVIVNYTRIIHFCYN
jgi:hypothetical protein